MSNVESIVTDITCPCGFAVIIDTPDRQIGISRQIRREWFRHQREEHPEVYATMSPNFAKAEAERVANKAARTAASAAKHNLEDKKRAKVRSEARN